MQNILAHDDFLADLHLDEVVFLGDDEEVDDEVEVGNTWFWTLLFK